MTYTQIHSYNIAIYLLVCQINIESDTIVIRKNKFAELRATIDTVQKRSLI